VSCNFCGSSDARVRYALRDWLTHKDGTFTLVECQSCGLLYLNPQPTWEELETFYPDQYHAYSPPSASPQAAHGSGVRKSLLARIRNVGWHRRSQAVTARSSGGRLLDIGCATGEFLAEMEHRDGWTCHGVEPVAFAAAQARLNTRADIFEGTLAEAHYPPDFFNVITLWDVLEHTADPAGMLREIYRILMPGGLLVIRVPDPESITGKLFGRYWIALDAPRHLYNFPKSILTRRLQQENFAKVETTYLSSDHFTFFGSLSVFFYGKRLFFAGKLAERTAYSAAARTLLAPAFLPFRWLGIGSSPVYFGWKS
jgi:SAM-dependent methyltransferase